MWSRKYEKCVSCGRTDIPHMASGYCNKCYMKAYLETYRQKNTHKIQVMKKEWYIKNHDRVRASHKFAREKKTLQPT